MRLPPILCCLIACWAVPASPQPAPLRVTVDSAVYLAAPDRDPRPGTPPYEPRIRVDLRLEGLDPASVPEFRLWRIPGGAMAGLPPGGALPEKEGGFRRVEGFTHRLAPGSYRIQAPVGRAWEPGEHLVVEVFLGGRWAGRGAARLAERGLIHLREAKGEGIAP